MKEFRTKEGGRKIYNEDFTNLQEIITSVSGFFSDCGLNFVISGCDVKENYIEEGYVFLEDHIRRVDRTEIKAVDRPVITPVTQVIYDKYEDGNKSEIATVYGTKVIPANQFTTGIGISGYFSDKGSYKFKSIIDTFWSAYTIVKNSNETQTMDVVTTFFGEVSASNADIKYNNDKLARLDGNSILFLDGVKKSGKILIQQNGEISFLDKDGNTAILFNGKNLTEEYLKSVVCEILEASVITTSQLMIDGDDVKNIFYTIEEYADTGWHNLLRVSTGEEVKGIMARSYLGVVYIQGTLPDDFLSSARGVYVQDGELSLTSGYYRGYFDTDLMLPDCIPAPSSIYINGFNVISPIFGTVGVNVFINNKTKIFFYILTYKSSVIGDLRPATEKGINMFSFPFYNINRTNVSVRYSVKGVGTSEYYTFDRSVLKFQSKEVCPSVSWQYSSDVPVELISYYYQDNFSTYIYYNPDSYILHVYANFERIVTKKNLTTGEVTTYLEYQYTPEIESITYSYEIINEKGGVIYKASDVQISTLNEVKDNNVKQYDGDGRKSLVPESERWGSYGVDVSELKSVPKIVPSHEHIEFDKILIKVYFKTTKYLYGPVSYRYKEIFGQDTKYSIRIRINTDWISGENGNTYICNCLYVFAKVWEYYEYRKKTGQWGVINYYNTDTQYDPAVDKHNPFERGDNGYDYYLAILEGEEYIDVNHLDSESYDGLNGNDVGEPYVIGFTWTDKALSTKSSFDLKFGLYKKSDPTNYKVCIVTITPSQYKLIKYTKNNENT